MGWFKDNLGPIAGAALGYFLAPYTGGLSIPMAMGLGAAGGSGIQSAVEHRNLGEALPGMALSGLGAYGAGSLLPATAAAGPATLSSSTPALATSLPGTAATSANIAKAGSEFGLGTSGLSVAELTAPYAGGAGYSLPNTAGTLANIGSAAPTGATAATSPGLLGMAKKYGPLAIGADYLAKSAGISSEQKATEEALAGYLGAHKSSTEWSDADRQNMMKAVMGIYSGDVEAAKRKTSSSLSSRGIGGGAYGKNVKEIERRGREAAARSLGKTFGPSGQPPSASAFFTNARAKGRSAGAETAQDALSFGGQLSTLALINQLFK